MTRAAEETEKLENICDAAIEAHLGGISDLPQPLADCVRQIYRDFVPGYLRFLRQREKKALDWFPASWFLDLRLADDMRHFFSYYQHVTKAFSSINASVEKLRKMGKESQSDLYRKTVQDILEGRNQTSLP